MILGRFPFVGSGRSEQSVLKWNARVLNTGSGKNRPAHGSQPPSSPAPVGQGAAKCTRAPWAFVRSHYVITVALCNKRVALCNACRTL